MKLEEYRRLKLYFASKTAAYMAYCSINLFIMDTMLSLTLLQILACPICKGEMIQIEDGSFLQCQPCNRDYPVIEGIPVLLPAQTDSVLRTKCEAP